MTLLYAWALLWITMDVRFCALTRAQKWLAPSLLLLLAVVNQTIGVLWGRGVLSRLLPLTMHLPVFLFFLYVTKCGVIKMVFMILTAMVFTSPIVLVTTYCKGMIPLESPLVLLINLGVCAVMLLIVFLIFRRGFHYLLKYGDNRLLALFCLVPFLYYTYVFAVANVDLTGLTSSNWIILRVLPSFNVYVFYFLLLYNSNGLENALNAAAGTEEKWVEFSCGIRSNKLLVEIKNPYRSEVTLRDGLPVSGQQGHGYGCYSIKTIAERLRGIYAFQPEDGIFTLRVVLPI